MKRFLPYFRMILIIGFLIGNNSYSKNLSEVKEENEIEVQGGALNFSLQGGGDKPFTIEFNDGRKAMLQVRELEPIQLEIPLKVDETTCAPIKPKRCSLHVEIKNTDLALLWTHNSSSPERLNKNLVQFRNENDPIDEDSKIVDFNKILSPEYQKMYPAIVKKIKPYKLVCDDYRFLTGLKEDITAPSDLVIIDWANEIMNRNNETNINENRPFLGTMNAIFQKTSQNTLVLKDIGQLTTKSSGGINLLFFGDIIGWTLQSSLDKQLCQVSFKTDVAKVLNLFSVLIREKEKQASFKPFIPKKDKFLWTEFLNDNSSSEDFESLPEPYKTLLQLKLVYKGQNFSSQNDGTTKIKTIITPLQIR